MTVGKNGQARKMWSLEERRMEEARGKGVGRFIYTDTGISKNYDQVVLERETVSEKLKTSRTQ